MKAHYFEREETGMNTEKLLVIRNINKISLTDLLTDFRVEPRLLISLNLRERNKTNTHQCF